ncbi:HEPN domain-containing protein [Shewanella sp. 1_MG-2023]|uniref:HEPN domain-containing protein n=1 Tax=unclassified Shewanella TaxID=196818 RepID=UPI0026E28210|nr:MULTISPECIES: HEPN domain-containing protein [unclassified Shewanella]MDO6613845.1 HEPN domain-containing protein [Shewanella sp. 7_MG-2023]MDO6770037.1 HEPN domain-containing protein [Shewanella sp. 2_MG-2023]MDO6795412.1 HEPN domain-containing protein [Shewanella sp. 1_MG-2023]
MSISLNNFKLAISDAKDLVECYDLLNANIDTSPPEALKRAALIMTVTAWETYVEDIATEIFTSKFGALKGCHIGNYLERQFSSKLKMFHNPGSQKTKEIFDEFFGVNVTESWVWNSYQTPKQVKQTLDSWLKRRGEAVHRSQIDITKPDLIKRNELDKCIRFISELVEITDKALESV